MMKRLTLLSTLLALTVAPLAARSDADWPGWMTVHVSGLPSHESAQVSVQYTSAGGAVKFIQQIATPVHPARLPLGSKAHDLHVVVSAHGINKVRTFRFATVPSSVNVDFNH